MPRLTTGRPVREFSPTSITYEMRLESLWQQLNNRHFQGKLRKHKPTIRASDPFIDEQSGRPYGHFTAWVDGYKEITIDKALCSGLHPQLHPTAPETRRWAFVSDVLLHEMVHNAVHGINRWNDNDTHAGAFAILAAGISQNLGLPQTTDWGNWPYNSRPPGYYGHIFRPPNPDTDKPQAKAPTPKKPDPNVTALITAINTTTAELCGLIAQRDRPLIRAFVK